MRLTRGVSLFALLCLSAACSSDEEAQTSPTTETSATGPASTSTTSAAPTTTAPTTAPTTTAAPTSTIDPTDALIAEIEADLNEGEQVFLDGAGDPASETSRTNLARYFTGSSLTVLLGFYDSLVAEGLVARPNSDVPSKIRVLELEPGATSSAARGVYCRIDAGVVVEKFADGSEAIVDDSIIRYDTRTDFLMIDGIWVIPGGDVLSEAIGVRTCD